MTTTDPKPYDLFISYAKPNDEWVEGYLIDALQAAGVRCISEAAFTLGAPRLLEFERAVQQSYRTLLVMTPAYFASNASEFVDVLAQTYGQETGTWPLLPVLLQEVELPPRLKLLQSLDATDPDDWPDVVRRLCQELERPVPGPVTPPPCPYPGMSPFGEQDSERFFGREAEVGALLQMLRLHPFVAVIGPSGSGKSSLVAAGLLPALRKTTLFGPTTWVTRIFRPGQSPSDALALALAPDGDGAVSPGADVTAAVPRLLEATAGTRLLLVVDQLEELFTVAPGGEAEFCDALGRLAVLPTCAVVVSMRADFYPQLMACPLWPEASQHRMEVLPLRGDGLQKAIVLPAEGVGVYVDSELVERLVHDASDEPGLLPLVQETMVCLWERLERRLLPLRAYETLVLPEKAYGDHPYTGLQVAMARRADAAISDLTPARRPVARRILLRLVQFVEGRTDVRRQQSVAQLRTAADDPAEFEAVLQHLAARRLVTMSAPGDQPGDRAVDLAHEALIRGWPQFQAWLAERREGEQLRRRLGDKAREWVLLGRGAGGTLDQVELLEAERWLERPDAAELGVDDDLAALVSVSREAIDTARREREEGRQRELAQAQALAAEQQGRAEAESARAEEEARAARAARRLARASILLATAGVVAVALVVATTAAVRQRHEEQRLSSSRRLAAQALSLADQHLDVALLLSQEANRRSPTVEARSSLLAALQRNPRLVRFLHGHTDRAGPAVFSPDGRTVAAGGDDGVILLWDAATGRPLDPPLEVGDEVRAVAYSPDGALLASSGHHQDHTVILWDPVTHERVGAPLDVGAEMRSLAFDPHDGNHLAIGSVDGTVQVWDLRERQRMMSAAVGAPVNSIAFTPDGKEIAVGAEAGVLVVLDVATGVPRAVLDGIDSDVRAVAVSPDGAVLASAGTDTRVSLWDLPTGQLRGDPMAGHRARVFGLSFSPDGHLLASGGRDGTVMLWNVDAGGAAGPPLTGHDDSIRSVAFSPDGGMLLTGSDDHRVALWRPEQAQLPSTVVAEHGDFANSVALSPDGRLVVSVGSDGQVLRHDGATLRPVGPALDIGSVATSVAVEGDGRLIAAGTVAGDVVVWDAASGEEVFRTRRTGPVRGLAFLPGTTRLAVVGGDGIREVQLFDVAAGAVGGSLAVDSDQLVSLAVTRDGSRLAAGGLDGRLWVWDLAHGRTRVLLGCPLARERLLCGRSVESLAFSADGKLLAAGSADKSISLWDPSGDGSSATPRRRLSGHEGQVLTVAFSPDGRTLASGGEDGAVILWDVANGLPVGDRIRQHGAQVNSVAFSPDGKLLLSAGDDYLVRATDVDFESWRARACAIANRNLDPDEWRLYVGAGGYRRTCPDLP